LLTFQIERCYVLTLGKFMTCRQNDLKADLEERIVDNLNECMFDGKRGYGDVEPAHVDQVLHVDARENVNHAPHIRVFFAHRGECGRDQPLGNSLGGNKF